MTEPSFPVNAAAGLPEMADPPFLVNTSDMRMPFGKHRGEELEDIPESYLLWVLDNCENASPTLRQAIRRTLGIDETEAQPGTAISTNIVNAWYRRLAREFHPDRGGTHEGMIAINRAHELLREMAG